MVASEGRVAIDLVVPSEAAVAELHKIDPTILVRQLERSTLMTACSRQHCSPISAGTATASGCTFGFPIRSTTSGNLAILTAGHCVPLNPIGVTQHTALTAFFTTIPLTLGPLLANGWYNYSQGASCSRSGRI